MMYAVSASASLRSRPATPSSPPAQRAVRRTWKDPRLIAGLVIVAGSVLLGARLLGTADDAVEVWAVRSDLGAGMAVEVEDLERQDVRFPSDDLATRYLPADAPLPDGAVLSRPLGAGELLPRAALSRTEEDELAQVPLAVTADTVPATLRPGAVVDVWVTPEVGASEQLAAQRVFEGVTVVSLPARGNALGPESTRQVVVGVPLTEEDSLASALGRTTSGTVVLVKRG